MDQSSPDHIFGVPCGYGTKHREMPKQNVCCSIECCYRGNERVKRLALAAEKSVNALVGYRNILQGLVQCFKTVIGHQLTSGEMRESCMRGTQDELAKILDVGFEFLKVDPRPGHEMCSKAFLDVLCIVEGSFKSAETGTIGWYAKRIGKDASRFRRSGLPIDGSCTCSVRNKDGPTMYEVKTGVIERVWTRLLDKLCEE